MLRRQLFHTGWFVESLATQTLVIFIIRTAGNPFRSRPSLALTATTVVVVMAGDHDSLHFIGTDFGVHPFAARFLSVPCERNRDLLAAGGIGKTKANAQAVGLRIESGANFLLLVYK